MTKKILRIDASSRKEGSYSRLLTNQLIAQLQANFPEAEVIRRDLTDGVPFVSDEMVKGMLTVGASKSESVKKALKTSDELIEEIKMIDILVIGVPIYNFGIPAALKAYIDLICRANVTFRYKNKISEGLLEDTKTYLIMVSAGTEVGSSKDYATGYLKHVLSFIGIRDVEVIKADQILFEGEQRVKAAQNYIANIRPVATF
ncbi:NAD(P)H-dependent oxidoreductase [Fulvivirgaceae bacterium BMA12]|uniref:FMN dependent NADH:quinone oxidoreductase n=1 Tax=Agaribacillus aureus TaxID=3051825 RepID=A0ABT8LE47_9BACT|nr:NAD(P)H-dependent oxidoreductase [Fulvivirgaceae bacterium BMA12]